jgi:L-alanine-DL-glutamate epimerase-like enolase superfamily enzyme
VLGTFHRDPDFGGYRAVRLSTPVKMEAAIEEKYTAQGEFTFKFHIIETELKFSSFTLTQMTAQYKNGDVQKLPRPWTEERLAEIRQAIPPNEPITLDVESLSFRHEDVTVSFKEYVTTEKGERISFYAKEKAGTNFYILTFWDDLQGV